MSKYSDQATKKERGASLTLEQYEIIVAFLKHGIKPTRRSLKNVGLTCTQSGGPDSGKMKTPFVRFRSIAKRLSYRESDGELIFKANSKIVLPNNRFEEVIMCVHQSHGTKHLNITRTIQKLSENYTIGCRQFGITEENVRMVIKKCKDDGCARRNKAGMGVLKNFVKNSCEPSCCQSKAFISTPLKQPDDSTSVSKAPVTSGIPVTLVRLPDGNFGIQSSITQNMPCFAPFKQVPLFDMHTSTTLSNPMQQLVSYMPYNSLATGRQTPYLPFTSVDNRASNPVPFPVQLVKVGAQPLVTGLQMYLVNGVNSFTNVPNTDQTSTKTMDLTRDSSKLLDLDSSASVTSVQSTLGGIKNGKGDIFVPQDSNENSFMTSLSLDENNNDILLDETNNKMLSETNHGIWSIGNYSNSEDVVDFTELGQGDQEMVEDRDAVEDTVDEDASDTLSGSGPCTLLPIPYKQMWYFYDDLVRQTNPYERISLCIKDMKLDIMKSLAGSSQSTERIKKKMYYIQELITTQKNVTQYLTDLYSAV